MTTSLSSQSLVLILSHKVWDAQITLVSVDSAMSEEKHTPLFVEWICTVKYSSYTRIERWVSMASYYI